jgi:hypothetical protein
MLTGYNYFPSIVQAGLKQILHIVVPDLFFPFHFEICMCFSGIRRGRWGWGGRIKSICQWCICPKIIMLFWEKQFGCLRSYYYAPYTAFFISSAFISLPLTALRGLSRHGTWLPSLIPKDFVTSLYLWNAVTWLNLHFSLEHQEAIAEYWYSVTSPSHL